MSTATPDLIKASPSPLRVGLVDWRYTVGVYLLLVSFQFVVNFLTSGVIYLSAADAGKHFDQAATNSACVTGIFVFICAILTSTIEMRACALSGASRPVLTAASYVHSGIVIILGSLIWWVFALTSPLLFFVGAESLPLGVDSWIFVVLAWVACDGAGRLIGGVARRVEGPWSKTVALAGAIPLGICGIGAPITWLVLTLVHKSGYLPPMHPAFYLLGLIPLTVVAAGWPLTASGHIRRVG